MIGEILITVYAGLEHAFEVDHLLAVNNLVSNRNKIREAIKDGIYWGIGHTLTIFFIGILMIGFKLIIHEKIFSYLEACVGLMLVILGIYRLFKLFKKNTHSHTYSHSHEHTHKDGTKHSHLHTHTYTHSHPIDIFSHEHQENVINFKAAFGVGLVHGLAGSGALVVLILSQMKSAFDGLLYILIFGIGSIIGMLLASGLFSLPFSKKILGSYKLKYSLIIISSILCIIFGFKVIIENYLQW